MDNKYKLTKENLVKIAKGAGITAGGAVLTYLSSEIVNIDFGQWTPIVMAFWSIFVNTVRKYLSEE